MLIENMAQNGEIDRQTDIQTERREQTRADESTNGMNRAAETAMKRANSHTI